MVILPSRLLAGLTDYGLDGWYLYGSWFITGESRHDKRRTGRAGQHTRAIG